MVLKIGHRGACGYEEENSISSFKKAMKLGVDMIELDIIKCKSGEFVVFHDETLERLGNSAKVEDLTLEQIRKFKLKNGEEIPMLEEVVQTLNKKTMLNIEIKNKGCAVNLGETILEYLEEGWKIENFLISSFIFDELKEIRVIVPQIRLGLLFESVSLDVIERQIKRVKPYCASFEKDLITKKLIDFVHKLGVQIFAFTVNEKDEIDKLKKLGVDGIFSNYPDKI